MISNSNRARGDHRCSGMVINSSEAGGEQRFSVMEIAVMTVLNLGAMELLVISVKTWGTQIL